MLKSRPSIGASLAALLGTLLPAGAFAIPIIAVDADPDLLGIQDERTVSLGETFSVLVVLSNDPAQPFDTIVFDLFQDPLFSAAVTAPAGSPTAGSLAAAAPLLASDVFDFGLPLLTGGGLTFGGSATAVGMTSLGLPFSLPDAAVIDVALFTLTAAGVGSSVLSPTADAVNQGTLLALGGFPVASTSLAATIHVVEQVTVSEPGSLALLTSALGMLGLVARRRAGARTDATTARKPVNRQPKNRPSRRRGG